MPFARQQATTVFARDLRRGATLVDRSGHGICMTVLSVSTCADGSLRVVTSLGEQRMTGSIQVRVLH